MKILLTGATGYLGSAILRRLLEAGHQVTAVVRSDAAAAKVESLGATAIVGDLTDRTWFAELLRAHDGAVHTASPGDETSSAMDAAVVDAALAAFDGTDKPFVHTGGIWSYGANAAITDASPTAPVALSAWREEHEARLLSSAIHGSVIRPAVVHGHGEGLVNLIVHGPRTRDGAVVLVGSGEQHWATVHVDDLADLYLLVLEQAPGGQAYLAASGDNPTVREIALAFVGTDGAVVAESEDETRARLGEAFAEALLLDQQATPASPFGWAPQRPSLVDELRATGS
jgi:nucleoside-diphosphate-sugar epimerase